MKLGTIRKIDTNGRIQLPADLREHLGISEATELNVYLQHRAIIIEPVRDTIDGYCNICGSPIYDLPKDADLDTITCRNCIERWKAKGR